MRIVYDSVCGYWTAYFYLVVHDNNVEEPPIAWFKTQKEAEQFVKDNEELIDEQSASSTGGSTAAPATQEGGLGSP